MSRNLTAICMVAGLLITGCGDDDEDQVTKAEFLKQGNAICKKGNTEIEAAAEKTFAGKEPTKQELTAFTNDTVVPNAQSQIDELAALTPPEDDKAEVEAIVKQSQAALDELEADPTADEDPFEKVDPRLKAFGLTACV